MNFPRKTALTLFTALLLLPVSACGPALPAPLSPAQSAGGVLDARSPLMPASARPYAEYVYQGRAGERLVIEMGSEEMDAYLYFGRLEDGEWVTLADDDDGGPGTDARLIVDLERTGEYRVRASAYDAARLGRYTLTLRSITPADPAPRPIQYEEQVSGSLAETDRVDEDGKFYRDYVLAGRRGSIEIDLTSTDFDAYLLLGRMQGDRFHELASDDDGGSGTDARISHALTADGEYVIRVTTFGPGITGAYGLRVQRPLQQISICVLRDGQLDLVRAGYDRASGDTLVSGRPFDVAHPHDRQYAAGAGWFVDNSAIVVLGQRYVKYGLPRVLGVEDVRRFDAFQGVPVFVEARSGSVPEVLYVPVRSGCEFQPYQTEITMENLRGR
jgi:hypothetical protein